MAQKKDRDGNGYSCRDNSKPEIYELRGRSHWYNVDEGLKQQENEEKQSSGKHQPICVKAEKHTLHWFSPSDQMFTVDLSPANKHARCVAKKHPFSKDTFPTKCVNDYETSMASATFGGCGYEVMLTP
ncbi:MAG: hypothetical protein NVS9B15_19070 [Acidobacteriaceae bacterium]